jgi:hypothetical protein
LAEDGCCFVYLEYLLASFKSSGYWAYCARNEGCIVTMGGIEVATVEYSHSVIVTDWQGFEELYEALLVINLWRFSEKSHEAGIEENNL